MFGAAEVVTKYAVFVGLFKVWQHREIKMSVRKDGRIIAGTTVNPDLFDWKWTDHILDNTSWLRADTFSWQAGSVYQAAYAHLVLDVDDKTLQSETVAGTTIQFYLADDGHKVCPASEESNVTAIYNTTGVAWYYIIDTTNQRFKLPRTKFGVTGLRDKVGNYVAPGLPDHTHTQVYLDVNYKAPYGSNNRVCWEGTYVVTTNTGTASANNPIYGASTTVQPPATEMYLYFYVGNFTPTALQNTAGLNAELFNDKVDKGHQVIAFQTPTAQNNYTWYRKYADGWVEQGGMYDNGSAVADFNATITLPVPMRDTRYTANAIASRNTGSAGARHGWTNIWAQSETQLSIGYYRGSSSETMRYMNWMVCGVAAS
jgi:hypothetical protein